MEEIYYTSGLGELEGIMKTDFARGISEKEAAKRLEKFGKNVIEAKDKGKWLSIFLDQFRDFMVLVLLGATLLSGLLGEYVDAITIIAIVIINAVLGFYQEYKAERSLEELKKMTAPRAKVMRSGKIKEVLAQDLVIGDLVLLDPGSKIPADLRLIEVKGLECNEASLTGESVAVSKKSQGLKGQINSLGDYTNLALMGTMVVNGSGKGIVIQTGMDAEMGKIAGMMQQNVKEETPLQQRLEQLGKVLVFACLLICALVVIMGIWRGEPVYNMFMAGVTLAVAAIPEGLPAVVTIALAVGVQRMMERKALVRKLPAVETLGCATVICSDKTGTLTKNKMKVMESYTHYDGNIDLEKSHELSSSYLVYKKAVEIGVLCNNSRIVEEKNLEFMGDPTENALLELGLKEKIKKDELIKNYELIKENSFDSGEKMMSVVLNKIDTKEKALFVKGAPETVVEKSNFILTYRGVEKFTREKKKEVLMENEKLASKAYRNIATAYRQLSTGELDLSREKQEAGLIFVNIFGLLDPPREESYEAIRSCKKAGIRTVMMTGDHKSTAKTIAKKINLLPSTGEVMEGKEVDGLSLERLKERLKNTYVFARVSPHHKLKIVKAFKELGHIVAMTGDGINDAPAVKASDIGIAMGKTGTDVTKNASELILSDDNFATIKAAVEEGRGIYDNIKKFIQFLLACNIGEILVMFWSMILALPLPLKPIQILWVNLVTDGLPAIALGLDSKDNNIMERPPRNPSEGIFTKAFSSNILRRGFLISITTLFVFYRSLELGMDIEFSRTMVLSTLVVSQLFYVFECQTLAPGISWEKIKKNPAVVLSVIVSFFLLLLVIYEPFFARIFDTAQLAINEWIIVFTFSLLPGIIEWSFVKLSLTLTGKKL